MNGEWSQWVEVASPDTVADSNYTLNGDGTVTDSTTGLRWQQFPPADPCSASACTWSGAIAYCQGLALAGFTAGWRLPTVNELASIVDYSGSNPNATIDATAFPGAPASAFWTSTSLSGNPSSAWFVNFANGFVNNGDVSETNAVRCVR